MEEQLEEEEELEAQTDLESALTNKESPGADLELTLTNKESADDPCKLSPPGSTSFLKH